MESNTDKIRHLEQNRATLNERVDNLRLEVKTVEANFSKSDDRLREIDKRLAILERDVQRLDQKIEGLLSRRWDLWKLVLGALLGVALTVAAGFFSRSLDRWLGVGTGPVGATATTTRPLK